MTILEPILYANGALRLTRHGAGKGDTVLLHVETGKQFTIADRLTPHAEHFIEADLAAGIGAEAIYDGVYRNYGTPKAPGFYHN